MEWPLLVISGLKLRSPTAAKVVLIEEPFLDHLAHRPILLLPAST